MTAFRGDALQILQGDARTVVAGLPAGLVDAVVTSPPYADARDDVACVAPERFADWLEPVLAECLRATAPTGSLMLNLGRRFKNGEESGYLFDALTAAKHAGWHHIDTIVWRKTNGGRRGGPYLRDVHEYVWWLARSVRAYRGVDDARVPYSPETLARFKRASRYAVKGGRTVASRPPHPLGARPASVFETSVGKQKGNRHPTPMPLALAEHLVTLACPPGGLVLDPFAGSGTTGLAAWRLGRDAILVDDSPQWCELMSRRLGLPAQLALRATACA